VNRRRWNAGRSVGFGPNYGQHRDADGANDATVTGRAILDFGFSPFLSRSNRMTRGALSGQTTFR
jgi:hypothetical protein